VTVLRNAASKTLFLNKLTSKGNAMNTFKNLANATLMATLVATVTLAATSPMAQSAVAASASEMTSGEVRKVDPEAQKITLKHGEIKNLDMPGMTMVFKVLNPALLAKVKSGDKVNFTAEKRDGAIVVTAIEVAK
jgi:Cu(I)/Ag(I) efflux system protein CusF